MIAILLLGPTVSFAQKINAEPDAETARTLTVVKTHEPLPTKIETDGAGNTTLVTSPTKAFTAFVLCVPSNSDEVKNCVSRVFVRDEASKTVYELRGEELFIEAGRPVSDIKWTNAYTLSYDRWSSPHVGRRYVVNMKLLKQTGGSILHS